MYKYVQFFHGGVYFWTNAGKTIFLPVTSPTNVVITNSLKGNHFRFCFLSFFFHSTFKITKIYFQMTKFSKIYISSRKNSNTKKDQSLAFAMTWEVEYFQTVCKFDEQYSILVPIISHSWKMFKKIWTCFFPPPKKKEEKNTWFLLNSSSVLFLFFEKFLSKLGLCSLFKLIIGNLYQLVHTYLKNYIVLIPFKRRCQFQCH